MNVTINSGGDINAALRNNQTVFLNGGTYKLSSTISLDSNKNLVGVDGQTVVIDCTAFHECSGCGSKIVVIDGMCSYCGDFPDWWGPDWNSLTQRIERKS